MTRDTSYLERMLAVDKHPMQDTAQQQGVQPVYFDAKTLVDVSQYARAMIGISRDMWSYFGYSGLSTPWHDANPMSLLQFQKKSIRALLNFLQKSDITVETYCILCCVLADYSRYDRPALLFCYKPYWSWLSKLRTYAGTRVAVDQVADFVRTFILLQVEYQGTAFVTEKSVVRKDFTRQTKYLATFHSIVDRIGQLAAQGVDYKDWLRDKFVLAYNALEDHKVYLNTVVNVNGFDPKLETLKSKLADPWREIREFLQLSETCEFPDGFLPKGWNISSQDMRDLGKVVRITGDGFYFYADGSQRRGIRHYAANRYFIIKCDPSNFKDFRTDWHDAKLLSAKPMWVEYERWAMFPGVWDEQGKSLRHTKDVKWRKR